MREKGENNGLTLGVESQTLPLWPFLTHWRLSNDGAFGSSRNARTVQFGPAEPFFQAYAVSIRGDEQSQRRALLWPPGKKNGIYDPNHR